MCKIAAARLPSSRPNGEAIRVVLVDKPVAFYFCFVVGICCIALTIPV
jgi:hypothetical protein